MKNYLELQDFKGNALFIDAEAIVAILDAKGPGGCLIYCSGLHDPLNSRISHFDLIQKLTEIGVFKLVKF
jgi:hypothetical protein